MSISFKEFSDILEKSVKSGAQKAQSKTGGQKGGGGEGTFKSTTAVKPTSGGGKGADEVGDLLSRMQKFKNWFKKKPSYKKDKKDKPDDKSTDKPDDKKDDKPDDKKDDKSADKKDDNKQARFGGIGLVDRKKDSEQRAAQEKKRREGQERSKRERAEKKKQARIDQNKADQEREGENKEKKQKRIKKNQDQIDREKNDPNLNPKKEETMHTEASRKANKLHIMHSAKQIAKEKDSEERERQAKDLEKKAKKMGFGRAEIEKILDDQGAYGEEYAMKKTMEEAEKMHSYMNTLSLERTANIWAEAAKEDEELEPVQGSKTLTKKTQEKVTINPMEKQAIRKG